MSTNFMPGDENYKYKEFNSKILSYGLTFMNFEIFIRLNTKTQIIILKGDKRGLNSNTSLSQYRILHFIIWQR